MNDRQEISNFLCKQSYRLLAMSVLKFAGNMIFCTAIAIILFSILEIFYSIRLVDFISITNMSLAIILVFLAGIVVIIAKRKSNTEIACQLDSEENLGELFATSSSLLKNDDKTEAADFVIAQASEKILAGTKLKFNFRKEKTILLSMTTLIAVLLASFFILQGSDNQTKLADNIAKLTSKEKVELANKFQNKAGSQGSLAKNEIREITKVIKVGSKKELIEALEKLKMLGVNFKKILPAEYDKLTKTTSKTDNNKLAQSKAKPQNKLGSIKVYNPANQAEDSIKKQNLDNLDNEVTDWQLLKNKAMRNVDRSKIDAKYLATMTKYFSDNSKNDE